MAPTGSAGSSRPGPIDPLHRRRTSTWLGLLPWLWMLCVALAQAADIPLSGADARLSLSEQMAVFEDRSAAMDIDAVVLEGKFSPRPELLHPGFTASAIWLKAEFSNPSAVPVTRWLALPSARAQEVSLFIRQAGRWQRLDAGIQRPSRQWPVVALYPVLPIELSPQERQTVYLRIAGALPIGIDLAAWEPDAFRASEAQVRLIDGLMLGALAVMALMGVLLVFMFRDRAFLFNALATTTYVLGEASAKGYGFMYLWPDAGTWAAQCLPLFALLGVGLNILFVRDLLATRRSFPRIDALLLTLLALQWLPAAGILFGELQAWAPLSFALNAPATAVLLLTGIYAMARGNYAARYYTAAYAVLGLGSLAHALAMSGMYTHPMGEYALPLAMLVSNGFMLVSVAHRVMQVRQENEAAQEALLAERASRARQLEWEVQARTAELEEASRQLELLAVTDALTGLANRRRLDQALATEWSRARRSGQAVGVIMLDIDYFKDYNDRYGHLAGDECLKIVAGILQASLRRAGELAARYGGEEFVAVVGETSAAGLAALAESIRCAVEARAIPHDASPLGRVTVSAGMAMMVPDGAATAAEALRRADAALYRAKAGGRNRVEAAGAEIISLEPMG